MPIWTLAIPGDRLPAVYHLFITRRDFSRAKQITMLLLLLLLLLPPLLLLLLLLLLQ